MTKTNQQEGEGMKSETELSIISEISKDIVNKQVQQDDLAVAAYVNQVCDQMKLAGEDIKDYVLVRATDINIGGNTIQYSIQKRS